MDRNDNFAKLKHLFNRAAFGISYTDLSRLSKKRLSFVVDLLLEKPASSGNLTTVSYEELKQEQTILAGLKGIKKLDPEQKMQRVRITKIRNEKSRQLNVEWMLRMMHTENPLLEKMTLFWHGHFACRSEIPWFAMELNNVQRTHALGNFKTLLLAVSKTPAMLQYLNNQQNKKGRPNENFARELMELFTLGRGAYTEQDIKEAARSFTGWQYNEDGIFEFNKKVHDEKEKTFFGQTGAFNGEAIIDIILKNPATATFICRKLYVFFVNDTPNELHVKELAAHFYAHGYNVAAVMRKMLTADWFYEKTNVGNKIKSPVEFLTGLSKEFYVTYTNPQVLIRLQSSLGQYLFRPPNVAGWPGGRSWIDGSSMMLRMRLPSLILNNGVIDFEGKLDPEDEALLALNGKVKTGKFDIDAEADWTKFFAAIPLHIKAEELAAFILAPALSTIISKIVDRNTDLKDTVILVTSMPEYQLC